MPFHIQLEKGDIPKVALIAGDRGRIKAISRLLTEVRTLKAGSRYLIKVGKYHGVPVALAAHEIGQPTAAIVAEELFQLGVRKMIRYGTSGTFGKEKVGNFMLVTEAGVDYPITYMRYHKKELAAMGRNPETSRVKTVFSPERIEASESLTESIAIVMKERKLKFSRGVSFTSDWFYAEGPNFAVESEKLGYDDVSMEESILFRLGKSQMLGFEVAALHLVVNDLIGRDKSHLENPNKRIREGAQAVLTALIRAK